MRTSLLLPTLFVATVLGSCATRETTETTQLPAAAATPLRGTHWVLDRLGDSTVTTSTNEEAISLLLAADSSAQGQAGCNRFRGTFALGAGNQLTFSKLLTTRMACPRLPLESRYLQALGNTARYQLNGDTLLLLGPPAGTRAVARFHAGASSN